MNFFRKEFSNILPPKVNVPHKKIMLCLNESSLNPLDLIKDKFIRKIENIEINRYFSDVTEKLFVELSNYIGYNISKENIIFGNGADDMIYNILLSVKEDKESFALTLSPSYFDYKTYANSVGIGVKYIYLDNNFDFDENLYISQAKDKNCKLAIICNPNNPTGNLFSIDKIEKIIQELPDTLILIDETYYEFSGITFVPQLSKYDNLVIIRSFSKAFSSAGLRFGYLITSPKNRIEISKCFQFFNTGLLTQAFALSILEEKELFLNHNNNVKKLRNEMFEKLSLIPDLSVKNSETNFIIISLNNESNRLFDYILDNDIAVRNVSKLPNFTDKLRISIGNEKDNNKLLDVIKRYFK